MLKKSQTGQVDIMEVARILNVKKRRMYDVTNILEGCGLIKKLGQRQFGWVQGSSENLQIFNECNNP